MRISDARKMIEDYNKLEKYKKAIGVLEGHLIDTMIRVHLVPNLGDEKARNEYQELFDGLMDGDARKEMLEVYYNHLIAGRETLESRLQEMGLDLS